MKCKTMKHGNIGLQCMMLAFIFTVCFSSCKDDKDTTAAPYDPSQPVEVTDFTPKSGGTKVRMIIYGSNFGIDPSIISVRVGGKEAKVISVEGNCLYCITPDQCYEGTIELTVGETPTVTIPQKYKYVQQMLVTTLCGYVDELGNGEIKKEGPFNDCGAFGSPNWLEFDPKYPHLVYVAADRGAGDENEGNGNMRILDLKNQYVGTALTEGDMGGTNRGRALAFFDENHMAVAVDQGDELRAAVYGFTRNREAPEGDERNYKMWGNRLALVNFKACNTVTFHPVDGDMYFSWDKGQFFKVEKQQIQEIFDGTRTTPADKEVLFQMDNGWEYNIRIHPTGNYAYIVSINKHYIQRTNYDWASKRFVTPFIVAGTAERAAYVDGIGTSARFNTPYQGVFVKNPEYAGQEDEYDFILCDKMGQCIRKITPQGKVSTFAGRGSASLNGNPWGYVDGDLRQEARFDRPKGIAYDEATDTYYIGDGSNRRIRKIAYEGEE
jgi:hypothetical protein